MKTINLTSENTSYSVPVYMEFNNTKKKEGTGKLVFAPLAINISMATNSNTTRMIYLENRENLSVRNISLYFSEVLNSHVNLSMTNISEIYENSSQKIDLTIISGENEGSAEGQIIARYMNDTDELFAYLPVFLYFIRDYVPTYEDNTTVINTKTCAELSGFKCSANETCPGEAVSAFDGSCCPVPCEAKSSSGLSGKIIGWALVALIVIFLAWFFMKKYRKTSNPVDLLKVASGKK